jgi:hypothetical protein
MTLQKPPPRTLNRASLGLAAETVSYLSTLWSSRIQLSAGLAMAQDMGEATHSAALRGREEVPVPVSRFHQVIIRDGALSHPAPHD